MLQSAEDRKLFVHAALLMSEPLAGPPTSFLARRSTYARRVSAHARLSLVNVLK